MIERFLSTIWRPVGFGEIRAIDPRLPAGDPTKVTQRFFDLGVSNFGPVVSHVTGLVEQGGIDVYFGVVPRMRRAGKIADVLPSSDVLWADLDAKANPRGKPGAWAALTGYPITPSIIVDSGNGYHAYWLLRDLVPFEEATLAMKTIARQIGGDHTHDAARVLRVPGTLNYKNPDDLLDVRVIHWRPLRYRWSDFDYEVAQETKRIQRTAVAPVDHSELPDWLRDLIKDGVPQGARSEACFKACVWLLRFGFTDGEIAHVFKSNSQGIGAKYAERKDGDRWLSVTLEAARARA